MGVSSEGDESGGEVEEEEGIGTRGSELHDGSHVAIGIAIVRRRKESDQRRHLQVWPEFLIPNVGGKENKWEEEVGEERGKEEKGARAGKGERERRRRSSR